MPKTGYRPNAGRPKGSKTIKAEKLSLSAAQIRALASLPGPSPLDFMLAVMRDETEDEQLRDRMAIAAAPYCHGKPVPASEKPILRLPRRLS